jgi:histidinol-phosphate aminotransferase
MSLDSLRVHGGPGASGPALHDFSTNSNACGPCPQALTLVQSADATRYVDASYTALRRALAVFHAVDTSRIVLAGSASEFIFRITAWVRQQGGTGVHLPLHAYGDYAHASHAWGLQAATDPDAADLVWACEPSSPLGQAHEAWPRCLAGRQGTLVLDCAYAPLRLGGVASLTNPQRDVVWQLFSPNKSLGLTGVRAAYAVAPAGSDAAVQQLDALAPSWVVGAHGAAMLTAWTQPDVQTWLAQSLGTLRRWKSRQVEQLAALGWTCLPSDANYFCANPSHGVSTLVLCDRLREQGIQLRDATSFGLPGWVRMAVLPPVAQDALIAALAAQTMYVGTNRTMEQAQ